MLEFSGNVLITGASGLLGANCVRAFSQAGYPVVAVAHRHLMQNRGWDSVSLDLTRTTEIRDVLARYQPRWVIHCAAATNVDWCEDHRKEAFQINAESSRALAAAVAEQRGRLVYISTDSVFDGRRGDYRETDAPEPLNVYARSKLAGEQAVQAELAETIVVRTAIYGWNAQPKQSLAEWILARLESGATVPGFTDVFFSPLLVNDLSEVLIQLMTISQWGLFHVAGREACSKYDFARRVARHFQFPPERVVPAQLETSGLRAVRPRCLTLDSGKIEEVLGRQLPGVDAGLERFKRLRDEGIKEELKSMMKEPSHE